MVISLRLVCILCLTLGMNLFISGQPQVIPQSQYYRAETGAWAKDDATSHRRVTIEKYSRFGKVSSEVSYVSEYVPPNRHRVVYTRNEDNKIETRETITIDSQKYCKEGKQPWSKNCPMTLSGLGLPSGTLFEYSYSQEVLEGKPINVFRKYATYESDREKDDEKGTMFVEWKLYINDDSMFVRTEFNRGYIGSKKWEGKRVTVWEYNPKGLKIEAPIK